MEVSTYTDDGSIEKEKEKERRDTTIICSSLEENAFNY